MVTLGFESIMDDSTLKVLRLAVDMSSTTLSALIGVMHLRTSPAAQTGLIFRFAGSNPVKPRGY